MSVTSNIVFVAVAAALAAVFFAVLITVLVRGKRRPGAFDITVRILASIVLLASAALYASSWLCRADGNVYIDTSAPALIIGETMRDIPLPSALFVALGTMLGSIMFLAVLILALAALICDCVIANRKKDEAEKDKKPRKTPEELKREAEIARIRRLADSAVKKTTNAASATSSATVTANDENREGAEKARDALGGDGADNVSYGQPAADEEPDFDWRVDRPQKQSASFVGIKEQSSDFDSFDTFDETDTEKPEPVDGFREIETDLDEPVEENDGQEIVDDFAEKQTELDGQEEREVQEQDYDGDVYGEAQEREEANGADSESAQEEQAEEAWEENDDASSEERVEENGEEQDEQGEAWGDDDIEPDRNIYIPEIRTIVRPTREPVTEKQKAAKPVAKKSAADASGDKPAVKKPTAKKTGGAKTQKPRNTAAKKPAAKKDGAVAASKRNVEPVDKTAESDGKKLPVTRRYVIMDRTSAVNIFSEYLKSKDEKSKDKLKSSISTIILK